jgi:MFS family permease
MTSPRRAAAHRSLRALSNRNFRAFFIGQVVSTVGTWMQMLAQAWLVLQLTDSGGALGITIALQTLSVLLIGAWGGVIADRVNNRRLLMITAVAAAFQATGLGIMEATGHITVHWVYLFATFVGVVAAFDRPAMQALINELVGPDDLPSAVGIASTINSSGRLIGPAIAGVLISTVGVASCFFVNAVSFSAVLIALFLVRPSEMFARHVSTARVRLRDGFQYVWHEPTLRLAMLVMTVVGTFAFNFSIMVPSMVKFEFHAGATALGVVQAIGGIGSVLGGLVVGAVHRTTTRVLGLAAIAFGVTIAATAVAPVIAGFALLWFPLGVASATFTTVDQTLLQRTSEPQYQGRVMSLFTIAWMGTTPVGGLIAGALVDAFSARAALGLAAVMTTLAGVVALAAGRVRMRREQPEVVVPPEAVPVADVAAGT